MTLELPLIYLDTNIVIHLADGELPAIDQLFRDGKVIAVYSEATIRDLARSTDKASRMSYLDAILARRIECNDHAASKAELIPQRASEYSRTVGEDPSDTSELEESLEEMFLHMAGAKTGLNQKAAFKKLSEAFQNGIHQLTGLPVRNRDTLIAPGSISSRPASANRNELIEAVGGDNRVGGIRPPNIITQVAALIDKKPAQIGITEPKSGAKSVTDIIECAIILGLFGFGSDKRIPKNNREKAKAGARSELLDYQHIAYSIFCAFFFHTRQGRSKAGLCNQRVFFAKDYHLLCRPNGVTSCSFRRLLAIDR